jgi:hypothetical protein
VVDRYRHARRARFFASHHAVQQRLRRGEFILRERAWLASPLQRVWQHRQGIDHGPCRGKCVACSRTENGDLFRHAIGGYGLFGVITDLELDMVPNVLLTPRVEEMGGLEIGERFAQQARVRRCDSDGLPADGRLP